ncbi:hypothetical protein HYX12_00145 [Candidatus Woesearchaeota archaeon]|nr:hypothetical protein [Candidatus Woesearchaeota archaeon]
MTTLAERLEELFCSIRQELRVHKERFSSFPEEVGFPRENITPRSHYLHLTQNLMAEVELGSSSLREQRIMRGNQPGFFLSLQHLIKANRAIETYFQLLADFSDYRDREMTTAEGYYPPFCFDKKLYTDLVFYVQESERRFRHHLLK